MFAPACMIFLLLSLSSFCIAFFIAAGGLLSVGYIGSTNKLISVAFLTVSVGCSALSQAAFMINHIDLAPQYAGVLMGITNTAGTLPGIVAPIVAKTIAHKVCIALKKCILPFIL